MTRAKWIGAAALAVLLAAGVMAQITSIPNSASSGTGNASVGYCNLGNLTGASPVPAGQAYTFDGNNCNGTAGKYTYWAATLTGNVTSSTVGNQATGQSYSFVLVQNAGTYYTFTYPATWITPPAVSTGLGDKVYAMGSYDSVSGNTQWIAVNGNQGWGQYGSMIAPGACPSAPIITFGWYDPTALAPRWEDSTNCTTVNNPGTTRSAGFLPATASLTGQNAAIGNTTLATQVAGGPGGWLVSVTIVLVTEGSAGTITGQITCHDDSVNTGTNIVTSAITISGGFGQAQAVGFCEIKAGSTITYTVSTGGFTAGALSYKLMAMAQRYI